MRKATNRKMRSHKHLAGIFLFLKLLEVSSFGDYNILLNMYNEMSRLYQTFANKYGSQLLDNVDSLMQPTEWSPQSAQREYERVSQN